jgi:hypothetical protein
MGKPESNKPKSITIYNKISNSFRELHVDGAYGGITPKGQFNINFYAERLAIPKSSDFSLEDNRLVKISDSDDSKKGIIREFETGIYMTLETAKEIHTWLGEQLSKIEESNKNSK